MKKIQFVALLAIALIWKSQAAEAFKASEDSLYQQMVKVCKKRQRRICKQLKKDGKGRCSAYPNGTRRRCLRAFNRFSCYRCKPRRDRKTYKKSYKHKKAGKSKKAHQVSKTTKKGVKAQRPSQPQVRVQSSEIRIPALLWILIMLGVLLLLGLTVLCIKLMLTINNLKEKVGSEPDWAKRYKQHWELMNKFLEAMLKVDDTLKKNNELFAKSWQVIQAHAQAIQRNTPHQQRALMLNLLLIRVMFPESDVHQLIQAMQPELNYLLSQQWDPNADPVLDDEGVQRELRKAQGTIASLLMSTPNLPTPDEHIPPPNPAIGGGHRPPPPPPKPKS